MRRPKVSWGLLIAYGMSVGVLQFSFLFSAIGLGMPAGLASMVMQMQVFFTLGLAALLLGERPTPLRLAGAGIALLGLCTIGTEHIGGAVLVPLLMTLLAAFFWSVSNIVTKRAGNQVDMFAFVIWGSLIPPLPMLALSLLLEGPGPLLALPFISPQAIFSVLFIAYGSTLLGHGGWAILLGRYPAGLVAPFALLVPVVDFVFLGETVSPLEQAGSLLIFAGLLFNVFGLRLLARLQVA
ncbi:MAG: EamA family transporter [Candidatus Devosia euplotis]|nr:EamA family transporter [Candidatus Devosia euplotis]